MGVAAYNRGSVVQARQLKGNVRPVEFEIMDRLNSVPKQENAPAPMGTVRIAPGHGGFWIYCPVTGFGYWYRTMNKLMECWRIQITGFDGEWTAIPIA